MLEKLLNLQRFADGGAEGAETGGAETGTETAAAEQNEDFASLTGKGGKYEKEYKDAIEKVVKKRIGTNKDFEARYNAVLPTLDKLSMRYGIDASADHEGIIRALDADTAYEEEQAMNEGVPVEYWRENRRLKALESSLNAQQKAQREEAARVQIESIQNKQAEEMKAMFPSFDLQTEKQNDLFNKYLDMGLSVKSAYYACHAEDIALGSMQYAAKQTEQNVIENIRANGARPAENGISSSSAAKVGITDVNNLTDKQVDELLRRVRNGETGIDFVTKS